MPADRESKTEQATPKKREDERKKGNIFQSTDVVSAISVLSVFVVLKIAFPYIYRYFSNYMVQSITDLRTVDGLNIDFTRTLLSNAGLVVLLISAPVLLTSILTAVITTGAQTRFKFSGQKIMFKFSNINPLTGIQKLFSLRSIVELGKSIVKLAIAGYVLYIQIRNITNQCINMMYGDVLGATAAILNDIMNLVIQISMVFIGVAALDYLYQWWDYQRNLRMTKQEVKEEFKQLEGSPEIKGRIRQQQRRMSQRRMMQQVPTADVIVRNPTHFAVALRYDAEKDRAPVVVAKGQDYVAQKIVEIAEANHIPMKEDVPLARALYAAVEVNMEIPAEFYQALAEVMAWVYQLKHKQNQ